jgi:hypothetical protein
MHGIVFMTWNREEGTREKKSIVKKLEVTAVNPFQSRGASRHHIFNSVLRMLQFFGAPFPAQKNCNIFWDGKG